MIPKEQQELVEWIKEAHVKIIQESGGLQGIRDEGGLAYTIHQICNFKEKNKDRPERIAAFVYLEFATKHHFMDGNKRTAHFAAQAFLFLYSWKVVTIEYEKAVPFIIEIAANKHSLKEIEEWIKENSKIT